jgi:hypothetical protein
MFYTQPGLDVAAPHGTPRGAAETLAGPRW